MKFAIVTDADTADTIEAKITDLRIRRQHVALEATALEIDDDIDDLLELWSRLHVGHP